MTRFAAALLLLTSCSAPPGPAGSDLEREVRRALARYAPEAKPSIWLAEVDGPELLTIDSDRVVPAASTIKVLILVEAHAQAKSGLFNWVEETTLREEDRVGGSGTLRFEKTGSTWTWLQLARRMIAESDPAVYAAAVRGMARRPAPSATASRIRIPTLVMRGLDDPFAQPAATRRLAELLPRASFVEIPGAHLAPLEYLTAFRRELERFVASVQGGRTAASGAA